MDDDIPRQPAQGYFPQPRPKQTGGRNHNANDDQGLLHESLNPSFCQYEDDSHQLKYRLSCISARHKRIT